MTEITENCIRLQKSFPNFLHSSHVLRCVAAYFFAKGADANEISLAEKPSVAQSIAKVLGAAKSEDGYLEGNGYVVSWCVGHLVELAQPAQPEAYDAKYSKDLLEEINDTITKTFMDALPAMMKIRLQAA